MSASDRHVVLDAVRQTLRCGHCRAETTLPPQPSPIPTFVAAVEAFTTAHIGCAPTPIPAPAQVRTGSQGAALKRDEAGLWWTWKPVPKVSVHDVYPVYQVRPLLRADALHRLRTLRAELAESSDRDECQSASQAQAALRDEGERL